MAHGVGVLGTSSPSVPCLVLPFLVVRNEIRSRAFHLLAALMLSWGFLLGVASIVTNYHYRLGLALEEHRIGDRALVWSLRQNQAVDVLFAAMRNLSRMAFGGAYEVFAESLPDRRSRKQYYKHMAVYRASNGCSGVRAGFNCDSASDF